MLCIKKKAMSQQWLHLYRIVKDDIDPYVSSHPKKMRSILNFKKLHHMHVYENTLRDIQQHRHHLFGQFDMSRRSLLYRLRKWFREDFHIITAPLARPSLQFIREAHHFFSSPENQRDIFYGEKTITGTDVTYLLSVIKTGKVYPGVQGYESSQIYLVIIANNETIDVEKLM